MRVLLAVTVWAFCLGPAYAEDMSAIYSRGYQSSLKKAHACARDFAVKHLSERVAPAKLGRMAFDACRADYAVMVTFFQGMTGTNSTGMSQAYFDRARTLSTRYITDFVTEWRARH